MVEALADGTTRPLADTTDYARLAAMTDEEIEANALADDNPSMTEQALARLRRFSDPKQIRRRLRLTGEEWTGRVVPG
jgi:putative transcriptional regulator